MIKKCVTGAVLGVSLLVVPVTGVSASSGTAAAPSAKIRVAVVSGYAALKAAKAQFATSGLDVSFVSMKSSKGAVKAASSGAVQFAIVDPGVAMWQATKFGVQIKIVAGAEAYKTKSWGIVGGNSVTDASSLYQQKIAIQERAGVSHLATDVWLDTNGADSTSVTYTELQPTAMAAALASGKVGAASGPLALLKGKAIGDPVGDAFGAGAPTSVVVAGAKSPTATIKKFVAALGKVRGFTTKLKMNALETEAETLGNYAFTDGQPDLDTLVWSGAAKA